MNAPHQQPVRRIPPELWQAARALAVTNGSLTLAEVGRRFGLSCDAVRQRASRERWRRLEGSEPRTDKKTLPVETEAPTAIVTLEDFRAALKTEVIELVRLVREARLSPRRDPVKVARAAAPVLARLYRIGKQAFAEPPKAVKKRGLFIGVIDGTAQVPPQVTQPE